MVCGGGCTCHRVHVVVTPTTLLACELYAVCCLRRQVEGRDALEVRAGDKIRYYFPGAHITVEALRVVTIMEIYEPEANVPLRLSSGDILYKHDSMELMEPDYGPDMRYVCYSGIVGSSGVLL